MVLLTNYGPLYPSDHHLERGSIAACLVHSHAAVNELAEAGLGDTSRVMVIAVEYGCQWSRQLHCESNTVIVLIEQVPGEEQLAFARRVLRQVVALLEQGAELVSAALAVAGAFDLCRLQARGVIARAMMKAFGNGVKGELRFLEPRDSTPDCRSHLTAIVEGLLDDAKSQCRVTVMYELLRNPKVLDEMPATASRRAVR